VDFFWDFFGDFFLLITAVRVGSNGKKIKLLRKFLQENFYISRKTWVTRTKYDFLEKKAWNIFESKCRMLEFCEPILKKL